MANWRKRLLVFSKDRTSLVGLFLVAVIVFTALLAPWIAPYDPANQSIRERLQKPTFSHPFGTDNFGRDILSRIIWGSRISLLVGILSILISGIIGTGLGVIGGYRRGRVDTCMVWIADVLLCFPSLILGLAVVSVLGPGPRNLIIAITVTFIPRFLRLARSSVLSIREREYILAIQSVGAKDLRILLRYVLPNMVGDIITAASLWIASAIIIEASISFLGIGILPPTPSWGNMIKASLDYIFETPWFTLFPCVAIFFAVFGFNMIGDSLRDAIDPKLTSGV